MKLLTLELQAYGPFTQNTLDFSGPSGLCLVYGANEAGKSSALRALTSFLYGIEAQTADAFRHSYSDLRVGGTLKHSDGTVLQALRKKGNKNTLLGSANKPVDDSRLEPFLRGVSRELFGTMFGIDHAQLRKGGEEMLKSDGQVGQALFSAGTGLVGLLDVSKGLEEEALDLFLVRGSKQKLSVLARQYQELKKQREESILRGADWKRLQDDLQKATVQREEMERRRQEKSVEKNRLERLQRAMPLVTRRGSLQRELQTLSTAMLLPAGFTEQRTQLHGLLQSRELQVSRLEQELAQQVQELSSFSLAPGLLERAEEIIRVHRASGQYLKDRADLPILKTRVSEEEWDARSLTKELRPELPFEQAAELLRLPRGKRDRIRELSNHYQSKLDKPKLAARNLEEVEQELARKSETLAALPAAREAGALRRVLDQTQRKGALEESLAERRRAVKREEQLAEAELGRLGQWKGSWEALERLAVPSVETVQRFETQLGKLALQEDQARQASREAEARASTNERDLEALRRAGEVPTEEELLQARAVREQGWNLVRRAWLEGAKDEKTVADYSGGARLEQTFERRVHEADSIADRLRRETARVEKQAALHSAVERHAQERARLEEERQKLAAQRWEVESEWMKLWNSIGVTPLPPAEMRAWLGRHAGLMEQARKLREGRQQVQELEAEVSRHREELSRALEELGAPAAGAQEPLEGLLARAKGLVKQLDDEAQRRTSLLEAISNLERKALLARRELEEAGQALNEWRHDWGQAVQVLGLSANDHLTQANAALNQVEELIRRLDEAAGFKSRIKGIDRNIESFAKEVAALCEQVAPELKGLAPDVAASRLHEMWQSANQQLTKRDALIRAQEQRRAELDLAVRERDQARVQLESLLREARCERYEELREVEERSERRRKSEEGLAACEQQLSEQSGGRALETIVAEVLAVEADQLPGIIERLDAELQDLEKQRSELALQLATANVQLAQMDGSGRAGELAEEAQGLMAEMRMHSERYLMLRLAGSLLQQQMEEWRKHNQNPLVERAATLFAALTAGHFSGLETGYGDKDEQVLYGVRVSREKVRMEAMSDGTRDQLFLALRLASLEQFLQRNEPLPLVIDDILINFDDERSTATLKVLAELAKSTQVLFFTHHAHLLALARKHLPEGSFQTLELPASKSALRKPGVADVA